MTTLIIAAEIRKLFRRPITLFFLVVLGLMAFAPAGLQAMFSGGTMETNGSTDMLSFTASSTMAWTLTLRNFLIFRLFLITLAAMTIAGEFKGRTLREDLLRPVSRDGVLWARWIALQAFVLAGLLLPWLVSLLAGLAVHGSLGEIGGVTRDYAATWVADMGFTTFVMAISLLVKSVPGTVVGTFMYWLLDLVFGLGLWVLELAAPLLQSQVAADDPIVGIMESAAALRPWLPSQAFNFYQNVTEAGAFVWQSIASLVVITVLSALVATTTFRRLDVP